MEGERAEHYSGEEEFPPWEKREKPEGGEGQTASCVLEIEAEAKEVLLP